MDIAATFDRIAANFQALKAQTPAVEQAGALLIEALHNGGKVMFCGNGGSAADSQHLAAELMGRYLKDRPPLPAMALSVDTSALTAIGNDFGYDEVFERQVRGMGRAGDVLVGISTSGNSKNVVRALIAARDMDIRTLGLTGEGGGTMLDLCDVIVRVPSAQTNHIQEMHIAIGHLLCGMVEDQLFPA